MVSFNTLSDKSLNQITSAVYQAVKILGDYNLTALNYNTSNSDNYLGNELINEILQKENKRLKDFTVADREKYIKDLSLVLNSNLNEQKKSLDTKKGDEILSQFRSSEIENSKIKKSIAPDQIELKSIALFHNNQDVFLDVENFINNSYPESNLVNISLGDRKDFFNINDTLLNLNKVKVCLLIPDEKLPNLNNVYASKNFAFGFELGYLTSRLGTRNILVLTTGNQDNFFNSEVFSIISLNNTNWKMSLLTELDMRGLR